MKADVVPVVVGRTIHDSRGRRVVVEERPVSVGVWVANPIELRQRDRLDDGKAPLGTIAQIAKRLLAIQAVEQLPRRITEPEERLAIRLDEKPLVLRNPQSRQVLRAEIGGSEGSDGGQNANRPVERLVCGGHADNLRRPRRPR